VIHHGRGLRHLLKDDDLAERIQSDYRTAGLSEKRLAMLTYAEKLTRTPSAVSGEDVGALRSAGLSDRDILDVVEVVAYYAYVNRIADGLGVEVEPWVEAAIGKDPRTPS
jgi:uncharacterized peroxidase-related enzyme